jgi:hypothetical protein
MLDWIDSPRLRRLEQWLWKHPRVAFVLATLFFVFIFFPQWGNVLWYSFSTEAPIPTIAKKLNWNWSVPVLHFSANWITGPIGVVMLLVIAYLLIKGKRESEENLSGNVAKARVAETMPVQMEHGDDASSKEKLVCVDTRIVEIGFVGDICTERASKRRVKGAIAAFNNRASMLNYVKARGTFYDSNNQYLHHVNHGVWLDEEKESIEYFDVGEVRKMVVAFMLSDEEYYALDQKERRHLISGSAVRAEVNIVAGIIPSIVAVFSFIVTLKPEFHLTQSAAALKLPDTTKIHGQIGYLECHVWDEVAERHLQGATVIAQNEHTQYKGTTNRDGRLTLSVPCGLYMVTITADRYTPRTDAVRVGSDDQKGFLDVSLQMDQDGRWLFNYNIRKNAIEELGQSSKEGEALLKQAREEPNAETQESISRWETKAAECIRRLFGGAEEIVFLSDSALEVYHILSASAAHRAILDRVNTRVIRLNKLIMKVNADVDKMMPWS